MPTRASDAAPRDAVTRPWHPKHLTMAIYGYNREDDKASEPMVLSEVTFQLCPEELRRVAKFLAARADEIDAGTFVHGGRHLRDDDKQWNAKDAGDVIVVPPGSGR
jgi:hypothetical protein